MKTLLTIVLAVVASFAPSLHAQTTTFALQSTDCGDHRSIVCTASAAEGGTVHIELGREKHALSFTNLGPNKLTATDSHISVMMVSGDGVDRLLIQNFSATDSTGKVITGSVTMTLTARNVNGTKNYTLTAGTVNIQ